MTYRVEKILDGFTVCFRQWNATHSHCHFLHGYDISFRLHFESDNLDACGWVWDFGWLKHPDLRIEDMPVKTWFSYMFDHTVLVAADDPDMETFNLLSQKNMIQLRVMPLQSCEGIAKFVFDKVQPLILAHSQNQARLTRVDVFEHQKNAASYGLS